MTDVWYTDDMITVDVKALSQAYKDLALAVGPKQALKAHRATMKTTLRKTTTLLAKEMQSGLKSAEVKKRRLKARVLKNGDGVVEIPPGYGRVSAKHLNPTYLKGANAVRINAGSGKRKVKHTYQNAFIRKKARYSARLPSIKKGGTVRAALSPINLADAFGEVLKTRLDGLARAHTETLMKTLVKYARGIIR